MSAPGSANEPMLAERRAGRDRRTAAGADRRRDVLHADRGRVVAESPVLVGDPGVDGAGAGPVGQVRGGDRGGGRACCSTTSKVPSLLKSKL